jgi:hypothetical protein
MPRGEDVEIVEPADLLLFLVALCLAVLRALTSLLFFTRHPSSFENLSAANPVKTQVIPLVGGWMANATESAIRAALLGVL